MKTFPAAFAALKNVKRGAAPVWILKVTAGGTDYYLSDNSFTITPWGVTTRKWVKEWGTLSEGIGGGIDEFRISDFSVTCLADPDASPNIVDLALNYPLEKELCILYLWFHGCADPPQAMFHGYVRQCPISGGRTVVTLNLQDETLRWERSYVGEKVTLEDYPSADPDDVGKIIPIPFGTVERLPAIGVNVGLQTSLPQGITAQATSFPLTSAAGLPVGSVVQIDSEQILINSIAGDSVTGCVRGYGGTNAVVHQMGAVVWQRKATFDYIASYVPLDAMPKVRAVLGETEVDITSVCTRYTGAVGDAHPSYPGMAVVTVPGYVTASQAVEILISEGLTASQAQDVVNALDVDNQLTVSTVLDIAAAAHTHELSNSSYDIPLAVDTITGGGASQVDVGTAAFSPDNNPYGNNGIQNHSLGSYATVTIKPTGIGNGTGIPKKIVWRYSEKTGQNSDGTYPNISTSPGNGSAIFLANSGGETWANVLTKRLTITMPPFGWGAGTTASIWDISLTVEVDNTITEVVAAVSGTAASNLGGSAGITGTSALAGALIGPTLSGNSVANTLVGDTLLVDVYNSMKHPADCIVWLLSTWTEIPNLSLAMPEDLPPEYEFNGAITEYSRVLDVVHGMAWQCRSWFSQSLGSCNLILRKLDLLLVKNLQWCREAGGRMVHTQDRTPYEEIINVVNLLYNRDWTQPKGERAYRAVSKDISAQSIADYGRQEKPELFLMDFVTTQAMADDLRNFYLSYYSTRRWLHIFESYLYDSELEFADVVRLGFLGEVLGQVHEASLLPGEDVIQLKVVQ